MSLPDYLVQGERARLFPVLADTSKEGRTTSIFLSCTANVREFGRALLASVGQRLGTRAAIEAYTEVRFAKEPQNLSSRPDGLLVVRTGKTEWRALLEAKVGANELSVGQIESYLELAALNGVDAVITISNQFSATPSQHPVSVRPKLRTKVSLYHWSWMYCLTQADLLLSNEEVADSDQRYVLSEMNRFLLHPSAGVKGFDQMPPAWASLVQKIASGGEIKAKSPEAEEVVSAWHQETRDLSLILSRQIGAQVDVRLPRAHAADFDARLRHDLGDLADNRRLVATFGVPGAAGPIEVCVDLGRRTMMASLKLRAPGDRQSTKARVNWLMRQLAKAEDPDLHVRMFWPGRAAATDHALAELRAAPEAVPSDAQVQSYEIRLVRQPGKRFAQARNFIADIEALLPDFYQQIVQVVKPWTAPPPKIREDRTEAEDVSSAALAQDAEDAAGSPPS